jgi:hypothetical protein
MGMRETIGGQALRARRALGLTAAVLCGLGALAHGALANSPIALDSPGNGNAPQLAFDHTTGTAYVAWSAPTGQHNANGVYLCVLPAHAIKCKNGVQLLTDPDFTGTGGLSLGGVVVLPEGETVVLGVTNTTGGHNGTVSWASTPGGGGFFGASHGLQAGGALISPVSLFYSVGNAVPLSRSDVGLLDDYGNFFSDSPFAGPESTQADTNPGDHYPRKALETNGPEIASEPGSAAGSEIVVGVGDNFGDSSYKPPGCINYAATGYAVSMGTVGAGGTLNTKGLPAYGLLTCSAESPVLAHGGRDGIGVLEQEGNEFDGKGSTTTIDYRPFIATASGGHFGSRVELQNVTSITLGGAESLDVSDDSATGVYGSWVDEKGLVLDYSPDGGRKWDGPVVVPSLPDYATQGDPVIAGAGKGQLLVAYDNALHHGGDQVFLAGTDAIPRCTAKHGARSNGSTVNVTVKCTSALGLSVTVRKGTTKLAQGMFTVSPPNQNDTLTVKLTSAGKRKLKAHDHLTATVILASSVFTTTSPLKITAP